MVEILIEVFSKLSYKIVWKFDCKLPRKPDNIFISKWFAQQGILGKIKNVKSLFNPIMTHTAQLIISFVQLIQTSSYLFIKVDFKVPKKLFIMQFRS